MTLKDLDWYIVPGMHPLTPDGSYHQNTALNLAFNEMKAIIDGYMPLQREPGQNVARGCDIINQASPTKALTKHGVLSIAVDLLKKLRRLEKAEADRMFVEVREMVKTMEAESHDLNDSPKPKLITQTIDTVVLPSKPANRIRPSPTVTIDEAYLRKLEREREILRWHLQDLERTARANSKDCFKDLVRIRNVKPKANNASKQEQSLMVTLRVNPDRLKAMFPKPATRIRLTLRGPKRKRDDAGLGDAGVEPNVVKTKREEWRG
ncbi:hypothetical protein MMC19_003254 [Ptychographa xylographoides]|nr:hypothetical protein [Ptychographa xylographoides]